MYLAVNLNCTIFHSFVYDKASVKQPLVKNVKIIQSVVVGVIFLI